MKVYLMLLPYYYELLSRMIWTSFFEISYSSGGLWELHRVMPAQNPKRIGRGSSRRKSKWSALRIECDLFQYRSNGKKGGGGKWVNSSRQRSQWFVWHPVRSCIRMSHQ